MMMLPLGCMKGFNYMILVTHSIVGGALSVVQKSVPAAFFVGLLSHYLMDMIPHYDYEAGVDGSGDPKKLKPFLIKIAFDGLLGVLVPLMLFYPDNWFEFFKLFAGIAGGVLPDFLQGVRLAMPNKILGVHQKVHDFFHSNIRLREVAPVFGIVAQVGLSALFLAFGFYI